MVRLITRQRGDLAALKLTKLFGIDDFPPAKDSGKVLIMIIYCYLTHWHLELFAKIVFFFDILVLLKLDRGQISFNLVENALVTRQLTVLVTRIAFKTF